MLGDAEGLLEVARLDHHRAAPAPLRSAAAAGVPLSSTVRGLGMREFRTLSKPSAAPALLRRPRVTPPMTRLRSHAAPIAVAALAVAGLVLRVELFGESLFADELSTLLDRQHDHDLGGVLSTVHTNAEITPPLSFVAVLARRRRSSTRPEMVRLPSLVAGIATIPLVYLLGIADGRPARGAGGRGAHGALARS